MRKEYTYGEAEAALILLELYLDEMRETYPAEWAEDLDAYREETGIYEIRSKLLKYAVELERAWRNLSPLYQDRLRERMGFAWDWNIVPETVRLSHQYTADNDRKWWDLNTDIIRLLWRPYIMDNPNAG